MPLHYCDEQSLASTILRIDREGEQKVAAVVNLSDGRIALITENVKPEVEER